MTKLIFLLFILNALLCSFVFFVVSNHFLNLEIEFVVGFSGLLIAGSWSFLSIETSKEAKVRDEHFRYINEFEDSVLSFIDEVVVFRNKYNSLMRYSIMRDIEEKSIEIKTIGGLDTSEDIEKLRGSFPAQQMVLLYYDMVNHFTNIIYKNNIVVIRGKLALVCVASDEEIYKIESLCEKALNKCREVRELKIEDINDSKFDLSDNVLTDVQEHLRSLALEKYKDFEERSPLYAQKRLLSMFLVLFGFFFSFWNYLKLPL